MLRVDHASLRVGDLDAAIGAFEAQLGLVPTRSPSAPSRHSRLYFDRSYLEVSVGASPGLELFFFGFEALAPVEAHLRDRGFAYLSEPYLGVDGAWDNLELTPPEGVPAPILVRRTAPPELARDWPPSRPEPWPCGVRALAGFELRVRALGVGARFFEALLSVRAEPLSPRAAVLAWSGGTLLLREEETPGIGGLLLSVTRVEDTAAFLRARRVPLAEEKETGILWAQTALGLRVGLVSPRPRAV